MRSTAESRRPAAVPLMAHTLERCRRPAPALACSKLVAIHSPFERGRSAASDRTPDEFKTLASLRRPS
jgi:hypothetical protein